MKEGDKLVFTKSNFHKLVELVSNLEKELSLLKAENQALKSQLSSDSHNSSKPPSSDGLKKKIVNLRERTGKPVGGQQGHQGKTLKFEGVADKIVYHLPANHCCCGMEYLQERQRISHEIDLPVIKREVTEHRLIDYHCSKCGRHYGSKRIKGPGVHYGPKVKSLAVYLKDYHFIPYGRLSRLFNDCFSLSLSTGSLSNFTAKAYKNLSPFADQLNEKLLESPVLHVDETGVRSEGQLHWVHVAGNNELTYYHFDSKRGVEGIERSALLPNYKGQLVHDRFSPYFHYGSGHSLCNAHLLRELTFLEEQGDQWAKAIKELLLEGKAKKETGNISKAYIARIKSKYKKIIRDQLSQQIPITPKGCRGKPKRSKSHNLLIALNKYNREILGFLSDANLPFDNNQAERDLRMVKTKVKVSGCFRSQQGGVYFARIRSFVATLAKQNRDILSGLQQIFLNEKVQSIPEQ